jgi:hypothetical protein
MAVEGYVFVAVVHETRQSDFMDPDTIKHWWHSLTAMLLTPSSSVFTAPLAVAASHKADNDESHLIFNAGSRWGI